jgi:hypothetical protein
MNAPHPAICSGTVFLSAVALTLLVSSAHACSCLAQSLKIQYYDASITRVVRAVVLREWPTAVADQAAKKYYQISVKQAFKGCAAPRPVRISTASNSAACGVDLNIGSEYLLLLSGSGYDLATHLCLANALFKDVRASDRAFLNSRRVCCGKGCICADGKPPVQCVRAPCSPPEKAPCKEAVKCVDNYCGGCYAEWFDKAGLPACEIRNPVM